MEQQDPTHLHSISVNRSQQLPHNDQHVLSAPHTSEKDEFKPFGLLYCGHCGQNNLAAVRCNECRNGAYCLNCWTVHLCIPSFSNHSSTLLDHGKEIVTQPNTSHNRPGLQHHNQHASQQTQNTVSERDDDPFTRKSKTSTSEQSSDGATTVLTTPSKCSKHPTMLMTLYCENAANACTVLFCAFVVF